MGLTQRIESGYTYADNGEGQWVVRSSAGSEYRVTTGPDPVSDTGCTCPAGQHGRVCKHLRDVWLLRKAGGRIGKRADNR